MTRARKRLRSWRTCRSRRRASICFDAATAAAGDAAGPLPTLALQHAHADRLPGPAGALDRPLAPLVVHVLGETADKRFVRLDFAIGLDQRADLHRQPDAVEHEPSRLLG